MDDFRSICLLSLAMLVACYVAGIIPLAVNFSEVRQLCQITRLLVGWQGGTAETGWRDQPGGVSAVPFQVWHAVRGDVVTF